MASAQALFLQGAQLTVMVLTLRKEPGIFWCCSQEQLSAQHLNKWSRIQQKETNILSPPPWTSHLSYTGEHWWLRSHTKEPSCSAPDSGKSWMWMGAREAPWHQLCNVIFIPPTAGTDCWELNSFGDQVVLVRTLKKMFSGGGGCLHGLCLRGLVMARMLACLLWFHSKLLLFGAGRLCTLGEKRMWMQLLEPEIRRGWARKAKSAKVWIEN